MVPKRMPRAYMFGWVTKLFRSAEIRQNEAVSAYKRSPVFSKRITAMPSIRLAAELPKNLLLGLKQPSIRMLCSGAMKK